MNNEELRYGNWIDTKEFHAEKLRGLYQYDPSWYEYVSMFEPIPLTEEWLIKFGFDVNNRPNWIDQLQEYSIVCGNTQYLKGSAKNIMPIKYVHQLQNLYFALTGEEITLNK